jgi:uncharacterized protein
MLRVDIRDLQRGPVRTVGELRPDDPAFEGLDLNLVGPVSVTGQLQTTGDGEYLWRGSLHGAMQGECRRCLSDVRTEVDIDVDAAVFTTDPEAADDPDFYPLAERANTVDVTDVVREELALAAQTDRLLCREDCAGLCPKCGADLNAGPCACHAPPAEPV